MVPTAFNDAVVGAWTCGITAVLTTLLVAPAFVPPRASATVWLVWVCVVATVIAPIVLCAYAVASFNTTTASTAASPPAGYWGHDDAPWWHGTPGNHDFCEENYAYSPFIAEFHNVWSSLPVIAYGSIGTWYTRRFATQEGRFSCAFISAGFVGVGSMLFHGNLLRWGQVLDEVPMMFVLFAVTFTFIESGKERRCGAWLPFALAAACLAFVYMYLVLYMYWIFLTGFIGGVCILVFYGGVVVTRDGTPLNRLLFAAAVASLVVGSSCWAIDDQFCATVRGLRLHIGWHIFTGLAAYLFVHALVSLRGKPLGLDPVLVLPRPTLILRSALGCPAYAREYGGKGGGVLPSGWHVRVVPGKGGGDAEQLLWEPGCAPVFLLPYVALHGKGGKEA